MNDFPAFKRDLLKDPEVLAEYEALKPEYKVIKALVGARLEQNLTQEQLAERTGFRQSNISHIESGNCSPTIVTLRQLANGMGKKLHIEFISIKHAITPQKPLSEPSKHRLKGFFV